MNQAESYAAMGDFPSLLVMNRAPSVGECITAVCQAMHVDRDMLLTRNRALHIAFARQLTMYVLRQRTTLSYPAIGWALHRDHSSVIHGCNLIARRMQAQPAFGRLVTGLLRSL